MKIKRLYALVLLMYMYVDGNVATAQEKTKQSFVKVTGEVAKPLQITKADFVKMNKTTVNLTDRDGKEHIYKGVPVIDILNSAGVTTGKQLHGENLTKYVMVKCADGYEVLFSLAEMDSSISKKLIILATEADGQPIPAGKGPFRLVVPGEGRPARSCFQVVEFVIKFAKDS